MTETRYLSLGDVVEDEVFPEVDLSLRRGRHIDRDDSVLYAFLSDAQEHLEPFYRRFGCELVHANDGYYYLLPVSDRLGRRHLSVSEMLVGQGLTLLYLDPSTVQRGGVVSRADALAHLASVVGSDALTRSMNPKRRKLDERVAQETVRNRFAEALRSLATLGFVEVLDGDNVRLRPSLMRFAEPVRGQGSPSDALARLAARGEIVLGGDELGEAAAEEEETAPFEEDSEPARDTDPSDALDDAFAERDGEPSAELLAELEELGDLLTSDPSDEERS